MSEDIKPTHPPLLSFPLAENSIQEVKPSGQEYSVQEITQNQVEIYEPLQEEINAEEHNDQVPQPDGNVQLENQQHISPHLPQFENQELQPRQTNESEASQGIQIQNVGGSQPKEETDIVPQIDLEQQQAERYYSQGSLPESNQQNAINAVKSNYGQLFAQNELGVGQSQVPLVQQQEEIPVQHQYQQIPVQEYRQSDFFAEKEERGSAQNSSFKFVGMQPESSRSVVKDQFFFVQIQKEISVEGTIQPQTKPIAETKVIEKSEKFVLRQQVNLIVEKKGTERAKGATNLVANTLVKKSQAVKIQQKPASSEAKAAVSQVKESSTQKSQPVAIKAKPKEAQVSQKQSAIVSKNYTKAQKKQTKEPNLGDPAKVSQPANNVTKIDKNPEIKVQKGQQTIVTKVAEKVAVKPQEKPEQGKKIDPKTTEIKPILVAQSKANNDKPIREKQQSYVKQLPKNVQVIKKEEPHSRRGEKQEDFVKQLPQKKENQQVQLQRQNNLFKIHQLHQNRSAQVQPHQSQHQVSQKHPQPAQEATQPKQHKKTANKKKKHHQHKSQDPVHPKQGSLPPNRLDNNNILPPKENQGSNPPKVPEDPSKKQSETQINQSERAPTLTTLSNIQPPQPAPVAGQTGTDGEPLTNQIIIQLAERERMNSTYNIFLKYMTNYTKALSYYKNIVENVYQELFRHKNQKRALESILLNYFEGYAKLNFDFNQECMKIPPVDVPGSNNPFGNIRLELRRGFDELVYLRKTVAAQSSKINKFVANATIQSIVKAFATFYDRITNDERKFFERRQQHVERQKIFYKVVYQVDKVFRKGIAGKYKRDILSEIARLINEEQGHREILRNYGKAIVPVRITYISAERQLFEALQNILNQFKTQSKQMYFVGRKDFHYVEDLTRLVKQKNDFRELSPLTDTDYIQYVLQIEEKKETNAYSNSHFEHFLELAYFDKVVGNIRDIYKGTINKSFPLNTPNEELIHTISGNLVQFNREMDHTLNIFVINNINAKIINEGIVEFDEVLKGVIFDDYRTTRVKLTDADRAQELICYLNQKTETIVVQ